MVERVRQLTGKGVSSFQGRYSFKAAPFVVGTDAPGVPAPSVPDLADQPPPTGAVVIRAGERLRDGTYGRIDVGTGKTGALHVTGKGASLDLPTGLVVGDRGRGLVVIDAGGALSNVSRADIGNQKGAFGRMKITGAGSRWVTDWGIEVGSRGRGELVVADGGYLSNGARADVGNHRGAFGEVTVSGKGSRWVTDWGIEVGPRGQGRVTIIDGGYLRNKARFDVAAHASGQGEVTVRGPGSLWESPNGVTVGCGGRGLLVVRDGGRVAVPDIEVGPGGQLTGDGVVEATVRNGGVVEPVERLTIKGRLVQAATGTVRVRLSGRGEEAVADCVAVDGIARLGGTVEVIAGDQYTPRKGDSFVLLQASSVVGRFEHVKLPAVRGLAFEVQYAPDAVKLTVTNPR